MVNKANVTFLKKLYQCHTILFEFRCNRNLNQPTQKNNQPEIHTQKLLLLLSEIRLSDTIMREFWLDVCNGRWNLESANLSNHRNDMGSSPLKIPMKKLFVEMLEAGIEWYEDEKDNIKDE
jgi:hypothetical protein